jgi:hypothetical protein
MRAKIMKNIFTNTFVNIQHSHLIYSQYKFRIKHTRKQKKDSSTELFTTVILVQHDIYSGKNRSFPNFQNLESFVFFSDSNCIIK